MGKMQQPIWQDLANCIGMDTNEFIKDDKTFKVTPLVEQACAKCIVKDECLRAALENNELGYWGGTTWVERQKMMRSTRPDAQGIWNTMNRKLQPCGTEAAYRRHRIRGEEPCKPCVLAFRKKGRERTARSKDRRGNVA